MALGKPDLCLRLCKAGWLICRLSTEMAVHDIAMSRFGQWWKRLARGALLGRVLRGPNFEYKD